MLLLEDRRFYVYVYLDPGKPGDYVYGKNGEYRFDYEPFYVGKGHDERWRDHLKESFGEYDKKRHKYGTHKCNKIRKIKKETGRDSIIIKFKEYLNEQDAYKLEIKLIGNIGREDLKEGILTNVSDGGDGPRRCQYTQEMLEKKCKIMKEVANRPEWKERNSKAQKIAQNKPEVRQRRSKTMKDKWKNDEKHRNKMLNIIRTQNNSIEHKEKLRVVMIKRYKDPAEIEKAKKIQQWNHSRQWVRDKISIKSQEYWNSSKGEQRKEIQKQEMKNNDFNAKIWIVFSPSGQRYEIKSLLNFCLENNISHHGLYHSYYNIYTYKGWYCYPKENEKEWLEQRKKKNQPKFIVVDPNGNEFKIYNKGLKSFCKIYKLNSYAMSLVFKGKQLNHKGWVCYPFGKKEEWFKKQLILTSNYIIINSQNEIFKVRSVRGFCKDNNLSELIEAGLTRVAHKESIHYQGWKCFKIGEEPDELG